MIHIEFISSSDHNILGEYQAWKNILSLGLKKTDIIINDESLESAKLNLIIQKDFLEITIQSPYFFHLGGKICFSSVQAKINDVVKFGETTFRIKDIAIEKTFPRDEVLKKNLELLFNDKQLEGTRELFNLIKMEYEKSP